MRILSNFKIVNKCKEWYGELEIYIMGKKVWCNSEEEFKKYIKEEIMDKVVEKYGFNLDYKFLINPTGRFVIGGPEGDVGLTGRKIIVDTYGGSCAHGGGAFSGKDPTKVDRSGAYMARYVCKNVVAAGLAKQCTVELSYAIGVAKPLSVFVDTDGTGVIPDGEIADIITKEFALTFKKLINDVSKTGALLISSIITFTLS